MPERAWYLIAFTALSAAVAVLLPAMPQPLAYHEFAERRVLLGIANFLDVASNAGFLLAGIAGLVVVARPRTAFAARIERVPYAIFFAGVLLTAPGSAYYHLLPDNARLFWDRLPMTVAFMSLVAAQVVDRVSVRAGVALLVPMLAVGAGSVVYWRATELAGAGNVMPYGVLQGYAVVILLLTAWLFPSRYTRGGDIYQVFAAYMAAKLMEFLDPEILAFSGFISGHSLKHLAAAVGGFIVCRMLMLRTLRASGAACRVHGATRS